MSRRIAWLVGLGLLTGCSDSSDPLPPCAPPPVAPGGPAFSDVTAEWGVVAEHHFATDFCELSDTTGGPGVCLFDADGDADLDIYFTDRAPYANSLFRNDGGAFVQVAADAGVASVADSMGCLAFDYDGDGDLDLYVTNNGPDQLFENRGGSFADVSDATGIASATTGFNVSATAGDIDGDGDMDLFVGGMVKLATCPAMCLLSPLACEPEHNLLLLNQGGRFVDVAVERGIDHPAPTLTSLLWDADGDRDLDLFVGNDIGLAFDDRYYVNDGNGYFVDHSAERGLDGPGTDTMGIDVGDYDMDGHSDVVISDFKDRPIRLYRCFDPATPCSSEVAPDSLAYVKWSVGLVDFDHDVDLDLFVSTGDVAYRDGNPTYLLFNQGAGELLPYPATDDDPVQQLTLSRGASFGDLDGDGDVDVVIANAGGAHQVWRNDVSAGYALTVELDSLAAGAQVRVTSEAGTLTEQALRGGGYAGSSDPRMHFGLGAACRADVTVSYLDGQVQTLENVDAGSVRITR